MDDIQKVQIEKDLNDLMHRAAAKLMEIEVLETELGIIRKGIEEAKKLLGVKKCENEALTASDMTRTTISIDPIAYFERVSSEEFFDSISISTTKAKKYLSSKHLEECSTTSKNTYLVLTLKKK